MTARPMDAFAHFALVLAVVALGLSAGALVTEGAVLVPFWRSLTPEAFFAWYRAHADLLFRFFGSLETVAAALALLALISGWLSGTAETGRLAVSAVLAVAVLGAFPLYFQRVNAEFAAGSMDTARVAGELWRWAQWHWVRTVVGVAAFVVAVLTL